MTELKRKTVFGIKHTVCALEPKVPVTNLRKVDRICQIDEFHIFT